MGKGFNLGAVRDQNSTRFPEAFRQHGRVGFLHSGAPAPGGNVVIAHFANRLIMAGRHPVGIRLGFKHLMLEQELREGKHYTTFGPELVNPRSDVGIITKTARDNPGGKDFLPEHYKDPERYAEIETVINNLLRLNLGVLVTIGGDDTMSLAFRLAHIGVPIVHIAKTIDTDCILNPKSQFKDHTFGFETAIQTIRDDLIRARMDADSENTFIFIEVMGRNSGSLAHASASISGCISYAAENTLPEESLDQFCQRIAQDIHRLEQKGIYDGVIVLSENLGNRFKAELVKGTADVAGNLQLYSLSTRYIIAEKVWEKYQEIPERSDEILKFRAEEIRFTSRQEITGRMAPMDIMLCQALGLGAANAVIKGSFGQMVYASMADLIPREVPIAHLIDASTFKAKIRLSEPNTGIYQLAAFQKELALYTPPED